MYGISNSFNPYNLTTATKSGYSNNIGEIITGYSVQTSNVNTAK